MSDISEVYFLNRNVSTIALLFGHICGAEMRANILTLDYGRGSPDRFDRVERAE